ncbi:MAG: RNA 2',3'-cyclic phosphodiesterase [Chloroflexota bacterium]|nr:RNA 2',3'-cyclic phosphodiesterase [Chloroflexota bacterium]MDE3194237.1 RNA 2',3'-cyclic phosphodiesterase [Chloroflexota bacterium]
MPRLFVAVPIPTDVAVALARSLPAEAPALRRVAPELLHVTLAFLGAVPEERVADAAAAVAQAVRGRRAFRVAFTGLGRFPEHGPPRLAWAGTDAGREIEAVGGAVRHALEARDLPFDPKPLRPHVTLARVREGTPAGEAAAVGAALAAARLPRRLAFTADAVHLMESVLSRSGPRYSSRARAALTGGGNEGASAG